MSNMKKLLDIMNEMATVSGSIAAGPAVGLGTQRRNPSVYSEQQSSGCHICQCDPCECADTKDSDGTQSPSAPKAKEFGLWKNSILAGAEQRDKKKSKKVAEAKNVSEITSIDKDGHTEFKGIDKAILQNKKDQTRKHPTGEKSLSKDTKKQTATDKKDQKTQSQQQARDAFGGMFGDGNPTRNLKIREQGVAESSVAADDVAGTLNSYGYYIKNEQDYVHDKTGDRFQRAGSQWKHQSGTKGRGPEELDSFLSSKQDVTEGERTMSRAAKGNEKYGKKGMQALAKAGREGASEKTLDTIRDKHNKYNESVVDKQNVTENSDQQHNKFRVGQKVTYSRSGGMKIPAIVTAVDFDEEAVKIRSVDGKPFPNTGGDIEIVLDPGWKFLTPAMRVDPNSLVPASSYAESKENQLDRPEVQDAIKNMAKRHKDENWSLEKSKELGKRLASRGQKTKSKVDELNYGAGQRQLNLAEEERLQEQDIIINPRSIKRIARDVLPKINPRKDREVEMARSDLYQSAKNAKQIYDMIESVGENQGLEGWVQEKIIKAADYLNTVREYLEGEHIQHMRSIDENKTK